MPLVDIGDDGFDYISGAEALIGADDLYTDIGADEDPVAALLAVAGATRRRGGLARRNGGGISPQQAAMLSKAHAIISQRGPTAARNAILGFGPVAIAGGGVAAVVSAPQLPFRGEKIIFPSDTASTFRLTSLIVGQANQLPNGNSIPGRTFDERADGMEIVMDTAQANSPISMGITNTGLATATFEASIRGTMVR